MSKFLYHEKYFEIMIAIIIIMFALFSGDSTNILPILGVLIIIFSFWMVIKTRYNKLLFLLFFIILYINITFSVVDLILKGVWESIPIWQMSLRNSIYNSINAKSILIFLSILNIFIDRRKNVIKYDNLKFINFKYKNAFFYSLLITFVVSFSISFWPYVISRSVQYVSNENPLTEYSIFLYILSWFFVGKYSKKKILLFFVGLLYSITALYIGDRSSSFVMLIVLMILNMPSLITIKCMIIFMFIAVILSQLTEYYRNGLNGIELVQMIDISQFFSNTVSFSYYSSIAITKIHFIDLEFYRHFIDYIKYIIVGFGINDYGGLAKIAREYYGIYNNDGGMFISTFYAFFGYFGVILFSTITGMILRNIYYRSTSLTLFLSILITSLSLRWYLYSPTTLFRSCLFIGVILFVVVKTIILIQKRMNI